MKCPDLIGRESWVWEVSGVCSEQKSSPQELGEEALAERNPYRKKTGCPQGKMIVVVVEC